MSIHQLLNTSRKSFVVIDAAMNLTGQNIANANTEGYARQRLTLQPDSVRNLGLQSQWARGTYTGAGVSMASIDRLRDTLLVSAGRDARSLLGASDEEHRILSTLEGLFPSTEGGRLTDLLDGFWNAWSDLADHPTDNGVRQTVLAKSLSLTSTINSIASRIGELQTQTRTALSDGVAEINDITAEIASLNQVISTAHAAGSPDFAAEDRRDKLVDELALLAPIRVQPDAQQGYTVTINGMTVVQGTTTAALNVRWHDPVDPASKDQVLIGNTVIDFDRSADGGGKLGAWLRTANVDIANARKDLDQFATGLATSIDGLHLNNGTSLYNINDPADPPSSVTHFRFFSYDPDDPAASVTINDSILQDPTRIGDKDLYIDTTFKTSLASAIAALRGSSTVNGETAENFLINLQSKIGSRVKEASTRATGQKAVVDHLEGMEKAVSGVNMDEEMTNLIKLQQAFAASARVLNTAQEMIDTLFTI